MASTTTDGEKQQMIPIVTSDNVEMQVARDVAERSILIKNLLHDLGTENMEPIPVPNVSRVLTSGSLSCHRLISPLGQ